MSSVTGHWVRLRVVRYGKPCAVCGRRIRAGAAGIDWNPDTKQLRHGACTASPPKQRKKRRKQKRQLAAEPRVGWKEAARLRDERRREERTAAALARVYDRREREERAARDLAAHPCSACPLRDVGREYPVGHRNEPWPRLPALWPVLKRALGPAVEGRGAVRQRLDASVSGYCSTMRERFSDECGRARISACHGVIAAAVIDGIDQADDDRPILDWIISSVDAATAEGSERVGEAALRDASCLTPQPVR